MQRYSVHAQCDNHVTLWSHTQLVSVISALSVLLKSIIHTPTHYVCHSRGSSSSLSKKRPERVSKELSLPEKKILVHRDLSISSKGVDMGEGWYLTPSGPASSWKTAGCSGAGSQTSSRAAVP